MSQILLAEQRCATFRPEAEFEFCDETSYGMDSYSNNVKNIALLVATFCILVVISGVLVQKKLFENVYIDTIEEEDEDEEPPELEEIEVEPEHIEGELVTGTGVTGVTGVTGEQKDPNPLLLFKFDPVYGVVPAETLELWNTKNTRNSEALVRKGTGTYTVNGREGPYGMPIEKDLSKVNDRSSNEVTRSYEVNSSSLSIDNEKTECSCCSDHDPCPCPCPNKASSFSTSIGNIDTSATTSIYSPQRDQTKRPKRIIPPVRYSVR